LAAVRVAHSSPSGGCDTILGATICQSASTTFSESEFYKDGIGPIGYRQDATYVSNGSSVTRRQRVEIVATSLTPADGATIRSTAPQQLTSSTLGAWTSLAPMPTARHAVGLAAVGGRLYAIGGFGASGQLGTNEEYDPATNTWRSRNPLPSTPTDFGGTNAAVVNDTIYMIGGNASGFCTSLVRAYHPATDTWSTKAPMPTPRCHLAVVALNGLIYAIGGTNTQGSLNYTTVEVYNPATNSWTTVAPMLTGRSLLAAGVANGRIHAFGGSGGSSTHESYDPATNQWSAKA
jgi:N-acetylneuraminic acid mutarotase